MRTAVTQFWDRRFIWHRIWHTKFQIDGAGATPAFPGQRRESIFAFGSNGRRWRCDAILGSPLYLAQDLAHKVSNRRRRRHARLPRPAPGKYLRVWLKRQKIARKPLMNGRLWPRTGS